MNKIIKVPAISLFIVLIIASAFFTMGNENPRHKITGSNQNIDKTQIPAELIKDGKEIYNNYCFACHGKNGKGDGPEEYQLETKPTNFTSGNIKFKSTPYSTLTTEEDIVLTLKLGVRTTAMLPQL